MFSRKQFQSNNGAVFSVRCMTRCYKERVHWDEWSEESRLVSDWVSQSVRELLRFRRCDLLLWEAGSWGRGQFGSPEVKGTSAVRSRYRATASEDVTLDTSVCVCVCVCGWVIVNCKVLSRAVSKRPINKLSSIPNPSIVTLHARDDTFGLKAWFTTAEAYTGEPQLTNIMCSAECVCKLNVRKLNLFFHKIYLWIC
jgi:hypothetical protein